MKRWTIPGFCQTAEKVEGYEGDNDTNICWSQWKNPQSPGKQIKGTVDQRKN